MKQSISVWSRNTSPAHVSKTKGKDGESGQTPHCLVDHINLASGGRGEEADLDGGPRKEYKSSAPSSCRD